MPLDAIADAIGASYALLFAERVQDGAVEGGRVHGVDHAYGDRLRLAAVEGLLPAWLRKLDPGTVMNRAALQQDTDFSRSAFFDLVVRPEGRFHCLITTPYVTPTQRFHMIVGRPLGYADFDEREIRLLRNLLPYIAHSITSESEITHAKAEIGSLRAAFDRLSDNVALIGRNGRMAFANQGASALLAAGDGLGLFNATIKASDPAAHIALWRAITKLRAGPQAPDGPVKIPRPSGRPALEVTLVRLDESVDNPSMGADVMLLIQAPDPQGLVDGWSAARTYGLTTKELDVAVQLSRGQNLRGIASTLGVSYQTVRCHLRGAFHKTDTHRQADLVRLILNSSPRLRR